MPDAPLLGPWVRRFLMEHLVGERNLARNTQMSYRDTLRLLLPDVARRSNKPIDRLAVTDLSADRVRLFLSELEEKRGCAIATRNQRLAAIHALARFIGLHAPELVEWCGQVRLVPFKKAPRALVTYLEKAEMDALLAAPDLTTAQGRRDHALLLFLYNSGARADEAAHVLIGDLQLGLKPECDPSAVLIRGKGNKLRRCPLWARTVTELTVLVQGRAEKEHVFLNCRGAAIDAVRHPHHGGATRSQGGGENAFGGNQEGEPAHNPAHNGNAPAASGCRHQHDPRLAGSRVSGDDQRLRGSRSGNEGQGAGQLRGGGRRARAEALPGRQGLDGVPPELVTIRLRPIRPNCFGVSDERHVVRSGLDELTAGC